MYKEVDLRKHLKEPSTIPDPPLDWGEREETSTTEKTKKD